MRLIEVLVNSAFFILIFVHEGLHYLGFRVSGSKPVGFVVGRDCAYIPPSFVLISPWSRRFVFNGGVFAEDAVTAKQILISNVFAVVGTWVFEAIIGLVIWSVTGSWAIAFLIFALLFLLSFNAARKGDNADFKDIARSFRDVKNGN